MRIPVVVSIQASAMSMQSSHHEHRLSFGVVGRFEECMKGLPGRPNFRAQQGCNTSADDRQEVTLSPQRLP
jgi:hypothetical protein